MQAKWKIWSVRIISLPVLLLLPFIFAVPGCAIFEENNGDSWPVFGMLGFGLGCLIAGVLSVWTLFIAKDGRPLRAFVFLVVAVALETAALLVAIKWSPKESSQQPGPTSGLAPRHGSP